MVENNDNRQKLHIEWSSIEEGINSYVETMQAEYDLILAIGRGGWVPGVMLSHILDIPVYDINIKDNRLLQGKNILIVDDIFDTGKTINQAYDKIVGFNPESSPNKVEVFTLFYRSYSHLSSRQKDEWSNLAKNHDIKTLVLPTYWSYEARNYWIVFPWEL